MDLDKAIFVQDICVLVVEPQKDLSTILNSALETKGFCIESCKDLEIIQLLLESKIFEIVVFEEGSNDFDDIAFLKFLSAEFPEIPCVLIAKRPNSETAIFAALNRTFAVFTRPFKLHYLGLVLLGAKAKHDFYIPNAVSDNSSGKTPNTNDFLQNMVIHDEIFAA